MNTEVSILNQNIKIKEIILILGFAAAMCISAYIKIPAWPVPFTMQIFVAALCGFMLPAKKATVSMLIYLGYGLGGAMVFTNSLGLLSPSFGYIIGFIAMVYIISKINGDKTTYRRSIFAGIAGVITCYTIGVSYMYLILHGSIPFIQAIMSGAIVFLPYDVLKVAVAAGISNRIGGKDE